jgi:TRAP-type C4-dicarboxylate transport system permease small subunit
VESFARAVKFLSRLCGYVAAALIGASVVVVCEMVFVRYVFGADTIWQTDFVTYSLVAATFVGSPYLLTLRGHVNVDVLPHNVGRRPRWWLALFASLLSLGFCVTIAILGFQLWKEAWDQKWVSDTMWRARLWIPYLSMPVGLGILALQSIVDLWSLLTGREAPFGIRVERHS